MAATEQSTMHRFAVTYKPSAGELTAWLVIDGVPAGTSTAEVEAALAGWRQWPEWTRRIAFGGHVKVSAATGVLARRLDRGELGDTWRTIAWSELAPESRTLTVPLPGELYGALSRQARARGRSLREHATELLRFAVESEDGQPW